MHPRFAERIASVLAAVKRNKGQKAATDWWNARWKHMSSEDYAQVAEAVARRNGYTKPPTLTR